jgi:hypothetical protein
MASNSISKSIYAAPQGIAQEGGASIDIMIEGGSPELTFNDDGTVDVVLEKETKSKTSSRNNFDENLAEVLDEGTLTELASELIEYIDADISSRKDWADTYVKGLEVLGFRYEERTEPWDDACGVYSTVLAEAAIRFQAETMSETFPAGGPVKTKIVGAIDKIKEDAAKRVQNDMNYKLTEQMVEYRSEHERMLYSLGLAGSAFKKVYYDPNIGRQVSIYISAEDVIVPYGASHIEFAERVTHVMRKTKNELKKLQVAGFYCDVDLGEPESFPTDIEKKKAEDAGYSITDDDRYTVYEVHADLIIDGAEDEEDEIARPYVVTIERGTSKILAIRRNWEENDELHLKRNHFVHYVYIPGFGFYGLGLIHIIGGYARAGTSIIRQLVDAGTLANLPGGLKSRGLRIKGDDTPIGPGEFKDVDVPSGAIKDNIMLLPYKEPSQVLAALLQTITEEGRRLGAISDMNISDMSAQAPVGTTLALLERTLKPMAAVQARVHFAMKMEFKLLKEIIRDYTPSEYSYEPDVDETRRVKQADYDMVEVIPVSDPNASTMAQRIVTYQAAFQMSQSAPQIYDLPYLHKEMLEVLGLKNIDKIIPTAEDQKPRDPISENMSILVGKPVKAFLYQDHEAHIATHASMMQDPALMQLMGQNPQAQGLMAAAQAHISEHLAFSYRKKIEEQLGVSLPAVDEEMSEEIEIQVSQLVAQAAKQLTQQHMQEAAQQQAQQQQQDPIVQMQQAELQLKQQEIQRKAAKDQADAQYKQQSLVIAKERADAEVMRNQALVQQQAAQSQQKTQADMVKTFMNHHAKSNKPTGQ